MHLFRLDMTLDVVSILQIAAKVLLASNQITNDEWQYFLRGGTVLDRTNQIPNPSPEWITELAWDNVAELIKALPAQFDGFVSSWPYYLYCSGVRSKHIGCTPEGDPPKL